MLKMNRGSGKVQTTHRTTQLPAGGPSCCFEGNMKIKQTSYLTYQIMGPEVDI